MNLNRRFVNELGRDLLTVGGLTTACMCIGLFFNQMRNQPLPLIYVSKAARLEAAINRSQPNPVHSATGFAQESSSNEITQLSAPQTVSLDQFQILVRSGRCMVLDARPEIFYRSAHVPGALNVSREEFKRDYANLHVLPEAMRNKMVIVYCSSESCEDSQMVAETLINMGYQQVQIFRGGWEEWKHATLPEEHQ